MGGNPNHSNDSTNLSESLNVAPLQFQPNQAWDIQSSHPELVSQGIASAVQSVGNGVLSLASANAAKKPDATSQAASAGKVGPVANMSDTVGAAGVKQYMRDPSLSNFMAMQYPTAFKYQPY